MRVLGSDGGLESVMTRPVSFGAPLEDAALTDEPKRILAPSRYMLSARTNERPTGTRIITMQRAPVRVTRDLYSEVTRMATGMSEVRYRIASSAKGSAMGHR